MAAEIVLPYKKSVGSFPNWTSPGAKSSLLCQDSFYCKSHCFSHVFLKAWSVFSDCIPSMTVALSWPRRYLVCIYAHLPVLACKLLISAEQLYVMTWIICCVTPMAASTCYPMTVSLLRMWLLWRTACWCVCMGVTLGNLVAMEKCLLSLSFILFSRNELKAVDSPQRKARLYRFTNVDRSRTQQFNSKTMLTSSIYHSICIAAWQLISHAGLYRNASA